MINHTKQETHIFTIAIRLLIFGALLSILVSFPSQAQIMIPIELVDQDFEDNIVLPPAQIRALWKLKRTVQIAVQDIYMGPNYSSIWSNIDTHDNLRRIPTNELKEGSMSKYTRKNISRSLDSMGTQFLSVTKQYCEDKRFHPSYYECNPSISNIKIFEVTSDSKLIGYLITGYISGVDPDRNSEKVQDVFKYLYIINGLQAQTSVHEVPKRYLTNEDGLEYGEFLHEVSRR